VSAVQLDEMSHDCESEAHSTMIPLRRTVGLAKTIEDERQHFRRNAEAGILDDDVRAAPRDRALEADASAGRSELDCVRHEVPDDLLKPSRVGRDEVIIVTVGHFEGNAFAAAVSCSDSAALERICRRLVG
jgi:hypothetical protein